MRLLTVNLLTTILFLSCSPEKKQEIIHQQPLNSDTDQKVGKIDELTGVSTDSVQSSSIHIKFTREKSFGSTDYIIIGVITTFTIDDKNRVFIADRDQTTIHVFHEEGRYLQTLGRQGRGPGEFMRINPSTRLTIHSEWLYITGTEGRFSEKVQVFSLEDLSFSHTIMLREEDKERYDKNLDTFYPRSIYPLNNGNYLVAYQHIHSPAYFRKDENVTQYFIHSNNGSILSGPVLKQKDRSYLYHELPGNRFFVNAFSFLRRPLFSISKKDRIYSARTDKFQIVILNLNGDLIDKIDYPLTNLNLTPDNLKESIKNCDKKFDEGICEQMIRNSDDLPDTWPALGNMLIDNENRLWVSTIVEDFDIYEWWVLEESGEMITKFEWPRDKPIREIRNSAIYTMETDPVTGLQQVVRYGFELVAR